MKVLKWIGIVIVSLIILLYGGFELMKYNTKKASPEKTAIYSSGDKEISVFYCSPSKKGRVIFGELEPFGKVWRTGANEATTFTSNADFNFNNIHVPAGEYTLWTIPNENHWVVILNSKMYGWGVDFDSNALREEEFDIAVTEVPVQKTSDVVEKFTIDFDSNASMSLSWDNTSVTVPISFN